jgi:tetratricopeptide (TPR) repeat protein
MTTMQIQEGARGRASVGLVLLVALAISTPLVGCATTRPGMQSFVRLETPHFEIVSSLGRDETRELAEGLELFHAGCLSLFGFETTPIGHGRTRVLAFDDRSLGRPFGMGAATTYFVPTLERPQIVFRVPGSWRERVSRAVRADYARRLLRSRSPRRLPLWLESGLADVASTIQVRGEEVRLGAVVEAYAKTIEDWRRSSFEEMLRTRHLVGTSANERALFEAQAWGLVHMLIFGDSETPRSAAKFPQRYLDAWWGARDERPTLDDRALLGGDGEALANRVYAHVAKPRFPMRVLRPFGWNLEELAMQPLAPAEVEFLLGELALELDRPARAERAFDWAQYYEPEHAGALAGLALSRLPDLAAAEPLALRAAAAAEGDAQALAWVGRVHAEAAALTGDPVERARQIESARRLLLASLQLEPTGASARLELASLEILQQDWEAAAPWLQSAALLRPGALVVDVALARLQWNRGWSTAARLLARDVISRSSWPPLRAKARRYLESPDS